MKKKMILGLAVILSFACFTGCGSSESQTESSNDTAVISVAEADENGLCKPTSSPEQTKVTIHSGRDYQMAAQLVTAKEKGYFDEAGLDVEITWYQTASDIPTAMISGDIDLAFGSWTNPMQVKSYGIDCNILASLGDASGTLSLIVSPDSGITSVEDITDKTLTLTNAAIVTRTLENICNLYGIDYDVLNIVNTAPSDGLASFMNGDVDAIFTWQPYCAQAIEAGGVEILSGSYDYLNDEALSDLYICGYTFYATESYCEKNPNTVAAIMWALGKAEIDLENEDSKAEIAGLTYETMGLTSADIALANLNAMKYSMEFTEEWADTFNSEIPYYKEIGSIPEEFDGYSVMNTKFLETVAPDWAKKSY